MTVQDGLPSPQRGKAVLVIVLGIAMAVMDGSIVNLALPGIARELNAGASQAIWVVNAYQIASLVMLLPLAALGDRLGYRRVYLVGMALFVLSSIAAMLATSLPMLTAARALQGLGAAGIMSVNTALVRLIYPSSRLGRGIAINSMVVATSTMAGPAVAAAILSVASWPWLFALNVPLGLLTLWMGRRALPVNPPRTEAAPQFSLIDVLLNVLMFTLVFVGADYLGVRSGAVHSAPVLGWALLAAGVAVGAVYMRRQWHLAAPLFPLDLLRIPVFALSMGSSLGAFCAQMLAFLSLPFLLLEVQGRSHMEAGLIMTAWPLAHGAGGANRGPADRALSRRLAGRHRHGGVRHRPAAGGPATRANHRARHGLAPRAVRRGFRAVPVTQQPHHRDHGTVAPQRRGQRHAGHRPAHRPDLRRGDAGGDLRGLGPARRARRDHCAVPGGGVCTAGRGEQFAARSALSGVSAPSI